MPKPPAQLSAPELECRQSPDELSPRERPRKSPPPPLLLLEDQADNASSACGGVGIGQAGPFHEKRTTRAHDPFHRLSKLLTEEHERQLASVLEENAQLRQTLGEATEAMVRQVSDSGSSNGPTTRWIQKAQKLLLPLQHRGSHDGPNSITNQAHYCAANGDCALLGGMTELRAEEALASHLFFASEASLVGNPYRHNADNGGLKVACGLARRKQPFCDEDQASRALSNLLSDDAVQRAGSTSQALPAFLSDDEIMETMNEIHNAGFPLRPCWEEEISRAHSGPGRPLHSPLAHSSLARAGDDNLSAMALYDGAFRRLICLPTSSRRLTWDILGAVFIIYDLIVVPLGVFDIEIGPILTTMAWMTLSFWTLNIPASVCVGYREKNAIVMDPRKIFRNYAQGWFIVDLLVVVPDWTFTIVALQAQSEEGPSGGQSVKLLRVLRLLRCLRLLRLLKLRWLVALCHDLIDSEHTIIMASIAKMILILLAINHYIACMWYWVADSADNSESTWVREQGFVGDDWMYKYATAFHWSITQFTPASMNVQPQNLTERVFTLTVVVFALVGFSYIVGSISASLAQLRGMSENASKEFQNLRRYLRQNKVPLLLSKRIQRYVEHAVRHSKTRVARSDVKLFELLSEQLYNEMLCVITSPHIAVHPLFAYLTEHEAVTMHRMASTALLFKFLARGDSCLHIGENATHVYFVTTGRLEYVRVDSVGQVHQEWVDKGEDFIAEPCLWTQFWFHRGTLTAHVESEQLLVNSEKFMSVIQRNPMASTVCCKYARQYIDWINNTPLDSLSDVTQGDELSDTLKTFIPSDMTMNSIRRSLTSMNPT
eukprot:TRINITY_DN121090_c0_g1_i1.p1 TRINITY_DN121090_c0_g1~~TRINITY_DN121090_c0_g1_i1.p1  ORF type:complete len:830 (+),score=108.74 TRINITY_DN121090_c0_g1_i1:58-2547(+)